MESASLLEVRLSLEEMKAAFAEKEGKPAPELKKADNSYLSESNMSLVEGNPSQGWSLGTLGFLVLLLALALIFFFNEKAI